MIRKSARLLLNQEKAHGPQHETRRPHASPLAC